jgi:hypothetical protein
MLFTANTASRAATGFAIAVATTAIQLRLYQTIPCAAAAKSASAIAATCAINAVFSAPSTALTHDLSLGTHDCSVIVTNFAIAIVAIGDISATNPVSPHHSALALAAAHPPAPPPPPQQKTPSYRRRGF